MKKIASIIFIILCMFIFIGCKEDDNPPIEEDVYYDVSFIGFDGDELLKKRVLKGLSVTAPDVPTIEGYEFTGWDKEFSKVESDLIINAIYIPIKYTVTFINDGEVVKEEIVEYGKDASAPALEYKHGYEFIGWDKEYVNVKGNKEIRAIWNKLYLSSYVEEFKFININDYSSLLDDIVKDSNLKYTFSSIKHGGPRGTNELIYYDEVNKVNTNIYGFEVAIDKNNIVIEKATKVDIPKDGFVLSAHGTSIGKLDNNINIGDTVIYSNKTARVYRNTQISSVVGLGVELSRLKEEILKANQNYFALDYELILSTFNNTASIYNSLLTNYDSKKIEEALQNALNINFMLVEPTSIRVNAMWHYPLRASGYPENNQVEVEKFLDKVKSMGINRIYFNTNFNGKAIYKSHYLSTSLTTNNTYGDYKDYLECFIDQAHIRGIEVYAWTNTLIAGDGANNSFYSSKGWLLKGINGEDNQGKMYFVDISNDEVQNFLENVFYELASYDLDGIEYDFIRYPSGNLHTYSNVISDLSSVKDWGYTDTFISKFMDEYKLTGDFLELIKTNSSVRANWLKFKTDLLTNIVEMLSTTARNANPDIYISAAVMPSITTARNTYLQDWKTWIELGYVDVLEPMVYTADNNYLTSTVSSMKNVVSGNADIVVGIFPEGSGAEAHMNASQINALHDLGVEGVSKFSSRTIFSSRLKDAYSYMNRYYTITNTASDDDIINNYIESLNDKIHYYKQKDYEEVYDTYMDLVIKTNQNKTKDEIMDFIKNEIINYIQNKIIRDRLLNEHIRISGYLEGK